MSSPLSIEIEEQRTGFRPGETLAGTLRWQLEQPSNSVELRLFWFTEGRGDRDVGIARTLRYEHVGREGSERFELELPEGPYSFSGRLISLRWALELVVDDGPTERLAVAIAPGEAEIRLDQSAAGADD